MKPEFPLEIYVAMLPQHGKTIVLTEEIALIRSRGDGKGESWYVIADRFQIEEGERISGTQFDWRIIEKIDEHGMQFNQNYEVTSQGPIWVIDRVSVGKVVQKETVMWRGYDINGGYIDQHANKFELAKLVFIDAKIRGLIQR